MFRSRPGAGSGRRQARLLAATVVPAVLAVALPAAADASQVRLRGTQMEFTASAGEVNHLRASITAGRVTLTDDVPMLAAAPCDQVSATSVRCAAVTNVQAFLGDRNDSFFTVASTPARVEGGTGDDEYVGGLVPGGGASRVDFHGQAGRDGALFGASSAAVTVFTADNAAADGRAGDRDNIRPDVEVLSGSQFDDVLIGNPTGGQETFRGNAGNDILNGNHGPNRFDMGAAADGADKVFAQSGVDHVDYSARTQAIRVTVDHGGADDGASGEGDEITGQVDLVDGGSNLGGDTLRARDRSTLAITLRGNGGPDALVGAAGNDLLIGGAGSDALHGLEGDDTIQAGDGIADRIRCGTGSSDTVFRDVVELEVADCEIVRS